MSPQQAETLDRLEGKFPATSFTLASTVADGSLIFDVEDLETSTAIAISPSGRVWEV